MTLDLNEGNVVYVVDKPYQLKQALPDDKILCIDLETQQPKVIKIAHLSSVPASAQIDIVQDISEIPERHIKEAEKKLEAITPVLNSTSRKEIEARANEVGVSYVTIYDWLNRYKTTGLLTSLVRRSGKGAPNKSRMLPEVDEIINNVIEEFYLTSLKPNPKKTHERIASYCHSAQLPIPCLNTIRNRLHKISERKLALKRGNKNAIKQYLPLEHGGYPDYIKPMHAIQIDHTPVDVILVDDTYRAELGRPYITLAIDVWSRMITGYYISFEKPSYMATSMAIIQSVLPKDEILKNYNLKSKWPIYGIPQFIHLDNAREFRGNNLKRVCSDYNMNIIWRPVGKSHFGGHIERLIGTINQDIHILKGTTKSNIQHKGDYDSQKESTMTLSDFKEWLAVLVIEKYHNTIHSAIEMTPLEKYHEGVFGSDTQAPKGLAPIIEDKERFKINMLPGKGRTIQRDGIKIDTIVYYHPILESFIKQKDPNDRTKSREFSFRVDPRDISKIYFYHPDEKEFYEIPYSNPSFPAVSVWEYRVAKNYLKNQHEKTYDQYEIFAAIERLRNIASESYRKTKAQRRLNQRQIKNKEHVSTTEEVENSKSPKTSNIDYNYEDDFNEDDPYGNLEPYEGIED